MTKRLQITLLAAALALVAFLSSCSLNSVSISDRLSTFIDSLNGDRTTTYQNLDPNTSAYTTTAGSAYWETDFPSGDKQFVNATGAPNTSNPSDVEITITGGGGYSLLWKFVMVNIGTTSDDWRIHSMAWWNGSWNTIF